jgi:uncharacterized phiE125 gp8 family phage protein
MMLVEKTSVPDAVLPLAQFKQYLRLSDGFADHADLDPMLLAHLRAAIAAIEAATGKILITRDVSFRLARWQDSQSCALPLAPVTAVHAVTLLGAQGVATPISADHWRLVADAHRPCLVALGAHGLPAIPPNGLVQLDVTAGFGPAWADLPDDLALACVMLGAHYYDQRHDLTGTKSGLPANLRALLAPYQQLRLSAGGARA